MAEFRKIKQHTVVSQVMSQLRELIASGEYEPGDRIPTEGDLAERFGIGRSSIREAIKIFNYLGILESKAAKGTFLRSSANISTEALSWSILLGKKEVRDLIEIRGALELWSIVELTHNTHDNKFHVADTLTELDTLIQRMEALSSDQQKEALVELDYNFHNTIISSTQNPIYSSIYEVLRAFMFEEIIKSQETYNDATKIADEHRQIVAAIKSGDETRAMHAFRAHISNIEKRLSI